MNGFLIFIIVVIVADFLVHSVKMMTDRRLASLTAVNKELKRQLEQSSTSKSQISIDFEPEFENLLIRVQQTDRVFPQLPTELSSDIDKALEERRNSRRYLSDKKPKSKK